MTTLQFFDAFTGTVPGFRGARRQSQRTGHVRSILAYFRARRDYHRLQDLPDYLLKDVGLTRDQIGTELRRPLF